MFEKVYFKHLDKETFYKLNRESCRILQDKENVEEKLRFKGNNMAYRHDKDLEFLRECSDEELNGLVYVLTHDVSDGKTRLTESLTGSDKYKQNFPNHTQYVDLICEEIQKFGGNTISNLVRNVGVLYHEILCDVCEKLEMPYDKRDSAIDIEEKLLRKIFQDSMSKASEEELRNIVKDLSPSFDFKDALKSINDKKEFVDQLLQIISQGKSTIFIISDILASLTIQKATTTASGFVATSALANLGLSRMVGAINPIFFAASSLWLINDVAGPAYRVTIPAVIQIAFLRQMLKERKREMERIEENLEPTEIFSALYSHFFSNIKLNLMIVGGTGVGKSSTINALVGEEVMKIGEGATPETQTIKEIKITNNLVVWDTPGLGESAEADRRHAEEIGKKLREKNEKGEALIDLVLVILDGRTRDYGTAISIINDTILPAIENEEKRILIAINKCDSVDDDREGYIKNGYKPTEKQIKYLNDYMENVKKRIDIEVEPIYYSAGKARDGEQERPYNIDKLRFLFAERFPRKKRLVARQETKKAIMGENESDKQYKAINERNFFSDIIDWVKENKDEILGFVATAAAPIIKKIKKKGVVEWITGIFK